MTAKMQSGFRTAIARVATLNGGYFVIEFAVALAIGSVALFADSIDFLEDTATNLLILVALGWSLKARARLGFGLALLLLLPTLATLWTAWDKILDPAPPSPVPLALAGLGALAVNTASAFLLAPFKGHRGSLSKAAFLSARNDAFANLAIIVTGFVTAATLSAWPDIVVGLAIAALNAGAAFEVWEAAHKERKEAEA